MHDEWWEDLTKTAIKRRLKKKCPDLPVYAANPLALAKVGEVPRVFDEHFHFGDVKALRVEALNIGTQGDTFHQEAALFAGLPSVEVRRAQRGPPVQSTPWPETDPVRGEGRSIEDIISTRRNNPAAQKALHKLYPTTKAKPTSPGPYATAKATQSRLHTRETREPRETHPQASQTFDLTLSTLSPPPGAAKYLLPKHTHDGHLPLESLRPPRTSPLPTSPKKRDSKDAKLVTHYTAAKQQHPHFVDVVLGQSVAAPERDVPVLAKLPEHRPCTAANAEMKAPKKMGVDFQPEQYAHPTRVPPGAVPKSWMRPSTAAPPDIIGFCDNKEAPLSPQVKLQSEFSKRFSKPKVAVSTAVPAEAAAPSPDAVPNAWTPDDSPKGNDPRDLLSIDANLQSEGTAEPSSSPTPTSVVSCTHDTPLTPVEMQPRRPRVLSVRTLELNPVRAPSPTPMLFTPEVTPSVIVIGDATEAVTSIPATRPKAQSVVSNRPKIIIEKRRDTAPAPVAFKVQPLSPVGPSLKAAMGYSPQASDMSSGTPAAFMHSRETDTLLEQYVSPVSEGLSPAKSKGEVTFAHSMSSLSMSQSQSLMSTPGDLALSGSGKLARRLRGSSLKKKFAKLQVMTSTLQAFRSPAVPYVSKLRRSDTNLAPSAPFHAPLARPGNEGLKARRGVLQAVVVGITMYDDTRLLPCRQAAGDAMVLCMILEAAGYSVTALHDGSGARAPTADNILEAVSTARKQCMKKEDICLFVFVGLGHTSTALVDSLYRDPSSGCSKAELHLLAKDFDVGRQVADRPGFIRLSQLTQPMEHKGECVPSPVIMCDTVSCYANLRRAPSHLDPQKHVHGYVYVGGRNSIGGALACSCHAKYHFLATYYFRKALVGHATREFRVTTNTFNVYLERKLRKNGYDAITTNASSLNGGDVVLIERHEVAYDKKEIRDINEASRTRRNKIILECFVPRLKYDAMEATFATALLGGIDKLISTRPSLASFASPKRTSKTQKVQSIPLLVRQVYPFNTTIISLQGSAEQIMLDKREGQANKQLIIADLREACSDPKVDVSFFMHSGTTMVQVHSKKLQENKEFAKRLFHHPEDTPAPKEPLRKRVGSVNFVADPDSFNATPLLFLGERQRKSSIFEWPDRRRSSLLPHTPVEEITPTGKARRESLSAQSSADTPLEQSLKEKRRKSLWFSEQRVTTKPLGGFLVDDVWDHCAVTLHGSEWHFNKVDKLMRAGSLDQYFIPFSLVRIPYTGRDLKRDVAAIRIQSLLRGMSVRKIWNARRAVWDGEVEGRRGLVEDRYLWLHSKEQELRQALRDEIAKREKVIRYDREVWEWEERDLLYQSMMRSLTKACMSRHALIVEEEATSCLRLEERFSRLLIMYEYNVARRWYHKCAKIWSAFVASRAKIETECHYGWTKFTWKHGSVPIPAL